MIEPLAHNTRLSAIGVPEVIEDPTFFPFAPGEREEWHVASDAELLAYEAYWDAAQDDAPEGWEDCERVNAAQHAANPNRLEGEL